jgi:hypothetical protein
MYINRIELKNFRTFRGTKIDFVHADQVFADAKVSRGTGGRPTIDVPAPTISNVNLLLGNNGAGKTTLLKAIAIAALGPAVVDANLPIYRLIRREPGAGGGPDAPGEALIEARFTPHEQDAVPPGVPELESAINIQRMGDVERVRWIHPDEKPWHPIYSAESDAYFFVGYGATRRVERNDRLDPGARQSSSFVRAQRIRSLFEEAYSLVPLAFWLPPLESTNKGRFTQVKNLLDRLLEGTGYSFTGERELGEYLFAQGGMKVPFPALSDGYRAYLGWVGDLLYHIEQTCPSGKKLVENRGIVMVDEIDLHLHPKWQMSVLPTLARALPNLQFIVTSHSPLVVGSLEWMNIILMRSTRQQSSKAERVEWAVHGLDADQVLLSDFFGLESTRAPGRKRELKKLALKAREGDPEAAKQLMEEMSRGAEAA